MEMPKWVCGMANTHQLWRLLHVSFQRSGDYKLQFGGPPRIHRCSMTSELCVNRTKRYSAQSLHHKRTNVMAERIFLVAFSVRDHLGLCTVLNEVL